MDKLKKTKTLLEKLAEEITRQYPDFTNASFYIKPDGTRDISVEK